MKKYIKKALWVIRRYFPQFVRKNVYAEETVNSKKNFLYFQIEQEGELYHLHYLKHLFGNWYVRTGRVKSYGVLPKSMSRVC